MPTKPNARKVDRRHKGLSRASMKKTRGGADAATGKVSTKEFTVTKIQDGTSNTISF